MSQHTPGPWTTQENDSQPFVCRAIEGDLQYGYIFGARVMCSDGGIVALSQFATGNEAEDAANARLIAAAPDLLAACKEASIELLITAHNARDAAKTDNRWCGVADQLMKRREQVEAAIAKAGGAS